jgi:hypothetical protein
VQTVRLPRDVITTNNGLCIELAILWASILDQLGCQAYILMRPGHAFTIVQAGDKIYPVECTAITPKAVGSNTEVPFEKAMQMALEDLQKQQYKTLYSVQQYRSQGYASPELPDVDVDKVKGMLASREREAADEAKNVAQAQNQSQPPAPDTQEGGQPAQSQPPPAPAQQGMAQYQHSAGLVSFSYPDSWKVLQPPTQLGITFRVFDPSTAMGMDVVEVPNASSANDAIKAVGRAFARAGSRIRVENSKVLGDLTIVLGHTTGSSGENEWFGVFRPVRGGVIGVAAGSPASNFQSNRPALLKLLDTVHFP